MPNTETIKAEAVTEAVEPKKEAKPKKTKAPAAKAEAKPEKKTRKPRARKVEELINEATKKMTDKEKDVLISYLREEITKLKNMIEALQQNNESAFTQCREIEKQYEAMEKFYKDSLNYIDGQVIAFANAVRKSTVVGGKN